MREKVRKISSKVWRTISLQLGRTQNIYFISGMCYNCSVFDNLVLPKKYNRVYIEWEIPIQEERLEDYAYRMAKEIDSKRKFILVGYSFGGVLAQEIAKFMSPEKLIVISSMKDEKEIPNMFQVAKKIGFADNIPMKLYSTSNFMINLFNRYVYSLPTTALGEYMTMTDPLYIKWALKQITNWTPTRSFDNIYHIHGTRDQVFPHQQIDNPITIKGGDHLMVIKRATDVSAILETILNEKKRSA